MKEKALLIGLIFLAIACSKESYLRLNTSDIILELVPKYDQPRKFRSNTNDTIELAQMSYSHYYLKNTGQQSNGGSLASFDYIETERIEQTIGSNDPYLRFTINVETHYNPALEKQTEDYLTISFSDTEGSINSKMSFIYKDSLQCISERCVYIDSTMKLQYRNFNKLYVTRRDSLNRTAIYWNAANGLAGFKTSDNKIYELIP